MAIEQPKKRWYRSWWFRVPIFLVGLVLLGNVLLKEFGGGPIETCDALVAHIIELREDDNNPLKPKLLKLYGVQASQAPDGARMLDCEATAKLSSGDDSKVSFYMTKDSDGDTFIGYQLW